MRNLYVHTFLFLFCTTLLHSQNPSPGGVSGAESWYITNKSGNGKIFWLNKINNLDNRVDQASTQGKLLNFNTGLYFNGTEAGLILPLPDQELSKLHVFSVYLALDTLYEKNIWSLEKAQRNPLVLTTHRMADLSAFKYMNFDFKRQGQPEISTYYQYAPEKSKRLEANQSIRVGGKPVFQNLPVRSFKGIIPEFIIYNRYLTKQERTRIESYLAIKYGITLQSYSPASYLNAAGQIIWNGEENLDYHHQVTGIGRDDASGLYQWRSTSSHAPGLLTIAVDSASLPNDHFMIWGDNHAILNWSPKESGQAQRITRSWLMNVYGNNSALPTSLQFDTRSILEKAEEDHLYWLLIDRSGMGNFSLQSTDYYPMNKLSKDGFALFDSIHWDTDGSGKDVFSIASGPKMLPRFQISEPLCQPGISGALKLTVEGGQAPYQLQIIFPDQRKKENHQISSQQILHLDQIEAGEYQIYIKDANGLSYRETFFVQSKDARRSDLQAIYELKAGETLSLNGAIKETSSHINYQWTGPNGFYQTVANVEINTPGHYELLLDQEGCLSKKEIQVIASPTQNIKDLMVYPNPTTDGAFNLRGDPGKSCRGRNVHLFSFR